MHFEAMKQIVHCPACGAANRIAVEQLQQGLAPVCGKCKSPLSVGCFSFDHLRMPSGTLVASFVSR